MMYSEFIRLSGEPESIISFKEYTDYIEPIYTNCELDKQDFIKLLLDAYKKISIPVRKKLFENLTIEEKTHYIYGHNVSNEKLVQKDFESRKIVYEYLKLYLSV